MNRAAMLACLPLLAMNAAAGRVPELNSKAICEARSAGDKMMRSAPVQTVAECVSDEGMAKQQLVSVWEKIPAGTRTQCMRDARALGTTSYLDFLTCMQMTEDLKATRAQDAARK